MNAYEILVIILSITLAILLVCTIIATVLLIGLLQSLKRLSERVEVAADDISEYVTSMARRAVPAGLAAIFTSGLKYWQSTKRRDPR